MEPSIIFPDIPKCPVEQLGVLMQLVLKECLAQGHFDFAFAGVGRLPAVETGYTGVMQELGERLLGGDGVPVDVERGQKLLYKAVDAGNTWAMGELGRRLLDGDGVPMDAARGQELAYELCLGRTQR